MNSPKDKIGFWTCTSLVVGNMIGSGVFLLPSSLASYGGISILGWLISTGGAILLATIFGRLSRLFPQTGGPYIYAREGFGEFAGFFVAWGYWISMWCGNGAIAVAFVGYMGAIFPDIAASPIAELSTGLGAIWLLTWINSRSIKEAGFVQVVTTALKLVPLLFIIIFGMFYMDMSHFTPFNLSGETTWQATTATAALTLWAFLGLESATVPAGEVENASRTIPRATMVGVVLASIIYIISCNTVLGIIPPEILKESKAPFAAAAAIMWGDTAGTWIAIGAAIATFGTLNGWILMQGQIPYALSKDKLLPAFFGKTSKHGAPWAGLLVSAVVASIIMSMNFHKGLVEGFKFAILLSTLAVLVPYLFSTAVYILIGRQYQKLPHTLLGFVAFAYVLWSIAGTGAESIYWGFLLLVAGIPVYAWMKGKKKERQR